MVSTSFRSVGADETATALATLASAFSSDPVERWLYPDEQQYAEQFPRFLAAFGGRAFDQGTVWATPNLSAVALWLPPTVEPDGQAIVEVLTETVAPEQHQEMYDVLDQMEEAHPTYPHWYLPWLGVEAQAQGAGVGGRLLAFGLDVVDQSGLPAYLETPNPRTVPLYERHGFRVTGATTCATCPPITFMTRAAR
jgi:GNAT superfamily N-acetyltransferase